MKQVAASHGLPEHRLQMGNPWAGEKPASANLPVTHKELQIQVEEQIKQKLPPQGAGGGRGKRNRGNKGRGGQGGGRGGRGRGGGGGAGNKAAWQIVLEKRSNLCPLFNYGTCPKTAETCTMGKHQCSKQVIHASGWMIINYLSDCSLCRPPRPCCVSWRIRRRTVEGPRGEVTMQCDLIFSCFNTLLHCLTSCSAFRNG